MQHTHADMQALLRMRENTKESVTHETLVEACSLTAEHKTEKKTTKPSSTGRENAKTLEMFLQTAINLYPAFKRADLCRGSIGEDYLQSALANATDIILHAGPNGLNGVVLMSIRPLSKAVQGQKIAWLKVVCTSAESNDRLKGLPRYLIFRALRRAKDCGATIAALHSTDWPDITRFYHELGFRCVRRHYDSSLSHSALWRHLYNFYKAKPKDQKVYVTDLRKNFLSEDELAEKNTNGRPRQLVEMDGLDENGIGLFDVMCNTPKMHLKTALNVYFGGTINKKLIDALKKNPVNADKLNKYKEAFAEFEKELKRIKSQPETKGWEHTDALEVEVKPDDAIEVDPPERSRTRAWVRAEDNRRAQEETMRSLRENNDLEESEATPGVGLGVRLGGPVTTAPSIGPSVGDMSKKNRTPDESQKPKAKAKSIPNKAPTSISKEAPEQKEKAKLTTKDAPDRASFQLGPKTISNRKAEAKDHAESSGAHPKAASSKGSSSRDAPKEEFPTHEKFEEMLRSSFENVTQIKGSRGHPFAFQVKMDFDGNSVEDFSTYMNDKFKNLYKFQHYESARGGAKKDRQYIVFFTNKTDRGDDPVTSLGLGPHNFRPGNALVWDSSTVDGGVSWRLTAPKKTEKDRFRVVMT